jgi:hypothetical protein
VSETTHTPGPWETQERDKRERGFAVIAVHPHIPTGETPTRGMVAWVGQGGANFGLPETQKANAHLIAAAPRLLTALESARRAIEMLYVGRRLDERVEAALDECASAIREARGEK